MPETLIEKYLGMPSDMGSSKSGDFKYLKDRLWGKMNGWIEKTISLAGKEVLIKSVAQAVPMYSMSCFKLPAFVNISVHRNFFWSSKEGQRKPHWVSWRAMTEPKKDMGLGFKDFEVFNLVLLAHQVWRLLVQPDSLCARFFKAIYYTESSIIDASLGSRPPQIWRSLLEGRDAVVHGLIRRIGDGKSTSFWGG